MFATNLHSAFPISSDFPGRGTDDLGTGHGSEFDLDQVFLIT